MNAVSVQDWGSMREGDTEPPSVEVRSFMPSSTGTTWWTYFHVHVLLSMSLHMFFHVYEEMLWPELASMILWMLNSWPELVCVNVRLLKFSGHDLLYVIARVLLGGFHCISLLVSLHGCRHVSWHVRWDISWKSIDFVANMHEWLCE